MPPADVPPPGYPTGGTPLTEIAKQGFTAAARDPAFAAPVSTPGADTKARARLVYRNLPMVTIQNTWSIEQARGALYSHMMGVFDASAQLVDSQLGDDRVTATLNSRATALFGREVCFEAADDSDAAREVLDAWVEWWPRLAGDSALRELFDYSTMMGFCPAQIVWDTSGPIWHPYLRPWHPRFTYYHWPSFRFHAISDGPEIPIEPGDGKWFLHAPYGSYRGWIRGAVRPVTEPWMLRHFGFRDMASFGEVHGNPTRIGDVPVVGDPEERAAFEFSLANLGADTAMIVPKGVDGDIGYDYRLVEATSTAWEVHPGQIDRCDMAIVLAIMMVNLTTEVKGGSYNATESHMDVREGGTQYDNLAFKFSIYTQLARLFAYINYGDAALAPWTYWDVTPRAELETNAKQFQAFSQAVHTLAQAGVTFEDADALRTFAARAFGLRHMPKIKLGPMPTTTAGAGSGSGKAPFGREEKQAA